MAKRFTDTTKWDRAWFRELPPKMKCAWFYLCDRCDHAGIWDIDMGAMSYLLGDQVTLDEILSFPVERIAPDKIFIESFVLFQYKIPSLDGLNPDNRAHKSVIDILSSDRFKRTTKGLASPCLGAKDKDKDKDKEMEKEKKKEKERLDASRNEVLVSVGGISMEPLVEEWGKTLTRYGVRKDPRLDDAAIFRLAKAHGVEKVRLALVGARFEAKTEGFDPSANVSIRRVARPDIFEKFVNLGAQQVDREYKRDLIRESVETTKHQIRNAIVLDDEFKQDPEKFRSIMGGLIRRMPKVETENK